MNSLYKIISLNTSFHFKIGFHSTDIHEEALNEQNTFHFQKDIYLHNNKKLKSNTFVNILCSVLN